jgi:hypothetical protein
MRCGLRESAMRWRHGIRCLLRRWVGAGEVSPAATNAHGCHAFAALQHYSNCCYCDSNNP